MYSQNREEEVILNYFNKLLTGGTPPDWVLQGRNPAFLDIGSNDGITFSNVRALCELGWKDRWKGVFVEPSPKAFSKLQKNYEGLKGFYFYDFALSNHNGNAILHESGPLCSANDIGLVSTFHSHEMDRFKSTVDYEPVTVKCFKWKTFLNRLTIKQFDFISMDCEGEELNILPDMDLSEVKMICIEWNSKPELKDAYQKYMFGFNLIYTSSENLIFAR
ncbi:MAG: FkbM family methyltransferase [Bacteroidota bacterium]